MNRLVYFSKWCLILSIDISIRNLSSNLPFMLSVKVWAFAWVIVYFALDEAE